MNNDRSRFDLNVFDVNTGNLALQARRKQRPQSSEEVRSLREYGHFAYKSLNNRDTLHIYKALHRHCAYKALNNEDTLHSTIKP